MNEYGVGRSFLCSMSERTDTVTCTPKQLPPEPRLRALSLAQESAGEAHRGKAAPCGPLHTTTTSSIPRSKGNHDSQSSTPLHDRDDGLGPALHGSLPTLARKRSRARQSIGAENLRPVICVNTYLIEVLWWTSVHPANPAIELPLWMLKSLFTELPMQLCLVRDTTIRHNTERRTSPAA